MKPSLRWTLPVLTCALALANAGCGSGSSERKSTSPAGPQPPVAGTDTGRLKTLAVAPTLGTASSFAVLGASTVTNTGPTVVNGDLGVSPGNAITGIPPGIVNGTMHAGDATALSAQNDITTAYGALAGQPCNVALTGQDLGGLTLTPGTYCFSSGAQLTGKLTLNGLGNAGAVWVFQIGSSLTTASGSKIAFINAGQACGAFWQVGSSATLGTTTNFSGNILALASITLNTGATNNGGLFARTGAVTLDSNSVSRVGSCGAIIQPPPPPPPPPPPGPGPGPAPVPALPEGAGWVLLVVLLGSGAYALSRH
jgi:Ice-binding-like